MPQVYEFQVQNQDVKVQLLPSHTVLDLMDIICNSWLDKARNGDGGIDNHCWKIATSSGATLSYQGEDDLTRTTRLSDLHPQSGQTWPVEYDFGSTTYFKIVSMGTLDVTDQEAAECPRQTPEPENGAVMYYSPPDGTRSLDDLYPNANNLLFGSAGAQWIGLFPCSSKVAAFVEAGPNAMGDMVFAPSPFGSVQELLCTLDLAGTKQPDESTRGDAFSRMIFPVEHMGTNEQDYQQYKQELEAFEQELRDKGVGDGQVMSFDGYIRAGLSQDAMYRLMGPVEVQVRLSKKELKTTIAEQKFDFDEIFPNTAAAFGSEDYVWFSYRRGMLLVCKGETGEGDERGVPRPGSVTARLKIEISSLQQLFCYLETMWPNSHKRKVDE